MRTTILYIQNNPGNFKIYRKIEQTFPCFIDVTPIEMDYSEVAICGRVEDWESIKAMIAPLL